MNTRRHRAAPCLILMLVLAACGSSDNTETGTRPTVVVTHSILGDIVEGAAGDEVEVVTIMGPGTDPHDFRASARDVDQMQRADALVVNGGGFEVGLADVIDGAREQGTPIFDAVTESGTTDPHFFTDPTRTIEAVDGLVEFLSTEVADLDLASLEQAADTYTTDLTRLDAEIEALLSPLTPEQRLLVTNHRVLGSFADRYGFEVVGTVVPSASTDASPNAGDLAELADLLRRVSVPAIFVDASSSAELAETLASEVGSVEVVALFSESLGQPGSEAETYIDLMRTNAARIAAALGADGS